MPVLRSSVDTSSETYLNNRQGQLAAIAALNEQLELARAGGGEKYAQRHRARGRMLARERIELLVDRDSPLLELSTLAAWGTEFSVGASIITCVGVVSGVECVLIAHDPTVRGGAMNPYTLRKTLRALEIARRNRLPVINLVESGGADLPTQSELFVFAGKIFHDLTELSAMGVTTIALVFGNSTAGGAYVPGMCDYAVLVDGQAKVFLGGPPLVKMATGEDADDEQLGGADMHSRVSGVADHFAVDEVDCIRIGREIVEQLRWRKLGPPPSLAADEPRYDPEELLGITSADFRVPFDPREVLARVVDGSRFGEYKPRYGTSLVTGWASIHGYPVGVLANERGVLFSEEAKKASEFILLANQSDTPLVFLQNTTGYMVGTRYEQGGIIKDGAKMINAVDELDRPAHHGQPGGVLRCRQLRHVRARLRPTVHVRVGQREARRHGGAAAGRRDVDRRPPVGRVERPRVRRRRRRAAQGPDRGADRTRVARVLHHRPALRRRRDRPARHARRCSGCRCPPRIRRPSRGAAASASSGCRGDGMRNPKAADRQPRRDRVPRDPHRAGDGHRHRRRVRRPRRRPAVRARGRRSRPPARLGARRHVPAC